MSETGSKTLSLRADPDGSLEAAREAVAAGRCVPPILSMASGALRSMLRR